jgi:hypothetical protein
MFTAVKGWNLHYESFETKEQFFDPRLNSNYGLYRQCSLKTVIPFFNRMFSRELLSHVIYEPAVEHWGVNHYIPQLWQAVIADQDIPALAIARFLVDEVPFNEDTGEDEDCLAVTINTMYFYRSSTLESAYKTKYFSLETDEEIIPHILAWIKETWNSAINWNNLNDTQKEVVIDPLYVCMPLNNALRLIFCHHFKETNYRGAYLLETGVEIARTDFSSVTVRSIMERRMYPTEYPEFQNFEIAVKDWPHNPRLVLLFPRSSTDRSMLYRVHNYTTNVTHLLPGPLREDNELSHNLYGIELEVACSAQPQKIIDATDKLYCALKQDSTISGSKPNKYEIVSTPATPKAHKKAWAQIFSKVGYNEFDVTRNTTNGMHIHVDCAAFNNKDGVPDTIHQRHFAWFFCNPVNKAFHLAVSERDEKSFDGYSALPAFNDSQSLSYLHKNILTYILPPFRGIVHFKQDNQTNQFVTLEVRQFKGIVSLGSICKNIEFVDSVFDFTRKTNFQANTVDNYLDYLRASPINRYVTLKEFLSRIGVEDLTETARLKQLLWGVRDVDKVKCLIDRHGFTITPKHIEIINSLIKGAKFGIGKNGELIVTETNRSRLYDLDLSLQEKLSRSKGQQACA